MPIVVGQDPKIAKRITCRNCGAINEYTPNEVRVLHKGKDVTGCMEVTEGFNCAQCGHEVVTRCL